jgi:phosphoserine phosphatase
MAMALFDLDNTLLAGDSDHAWNEFLIHEGVAGQDFKEGNDRFYEDYVQGRLDIVAYLHFAITPLKGSTLRDLEPLRRKFVQEWVTSMIAPKA